MASHYAEPLIRRAAAATPLLSAPGADLDGEMLQPGDLFAVLDCSRGLAWGFRQSDHRVGYVDQEMLQAV